jgi:hypothetical protein
LKLSDDLWEITDKLLDMGVEEFTKLYYAGQLPTIKFIYGLDERESKVTELKQSFLGSD